VIQFGDTLPSSWRSSFMVAIAAHIAAIAFFGFGSAVPKRPPEVREVTLIRLSGGGENVPGWIKPTTAPSDNVKVPDKKPKIEAKPPTGTHVAEIEKPSEILAEESPVEEEIIAEVEESAGEGVGVKPGPEGPGWGIKSDADFPGGVAYLSRVEAEVQRRFNFRGRGTGAMAEYHFLIEKRGKSTELILMKSSSIPSLDLAARSAIVRARFAPLPAGFRHQKLGITFRFYDAK